jgi:hypothetical protein
MQPRGSPLGCYFKCPLDIRCIAMPLKRRDSSPRAMGDYTFDETIPLAKQNEEAILRDAFAHDLAGVVVRRLANL